MDVVVALIPSQIPLSLLVIVKPNIVSLLLVSNIYSFLFLFQISVIFKLLLNQPPLGFLLKQFYIPFTPKKIVNDDGRTKEKKIPKEIYYIDNISS